MLYRLHLTPAPQRAKTLVTACIVLLLAACASKLPPPSKPSPPPATPTTPVTSLPPAEPPILRLSAASNILDYRKDAADYLYRLHSDTIYVGRMPPLLYAVGVLQTDIDKRGYVTGVRWMRAPSHAPEVMAEIERMARAAAPYPAPVKLGSVTYTETWLWHKSGRWQLHTLSEGQN